ncbi:hypothetical protein, partial [Streptomyces sp. Tu 6176]|uniref:hypothetical protein n=1 Tax=Streptomyces sp. Tu 6176 TaxID=1470557 RepID=UPI001F2EFFD9
MRDGRVLLGAAEAALARAHHPHRRTGEEVGLVVLRTVPGGVLSDRQHAQRDGQHQQQHRTGAARGAA